MCGKCSTHSTLYIKSSCKVNQLEYCTASSVTGEIWHKNKNVRKSDTGCTFLKGMKTCTKEAQLHSKGKLLCTTTTTKRK